jgi:hypothetical protein
MEAASFVSIERDRNASLDKALRSAIVSNLCLLVLTACLLAAIHYHGKALEQKTADSR